MFHDWENFYLIVGPSEAALIGLLFVVVTLTSGEDRRQAAWGQTLFMTPIVFHFGVILVLSGLAGAPALHRSSTSIIVALAAVCGFAYSLRNALGMRKDAEQTPPHWSDIWCYAYGPAAIYVVLLTSAAALWRSLWFGEHLMAASLMALLLLSIRNAWDLVTWLAPREEEKAP